MCFSRAILASKLCRLTVSMKDGSLYVLMCYSCEVFRCIFVRMAHVPETLEKNPGGTWRTRRRRLQRKRVAAVLWGHAFAAVFLRCMLGKRMGASLPDSSSTSSRRSTRDEGTLDIDVESLRDARDGMFDRWSLLSGELLHKSERVSSRHSKDDSLLCVGRYGMFDRWASLVANLCLTIMVCAFVS